MPSKLSKENVELRIAKISVIIALILLVLSLVYSARASNVNYSWASWYGPGLYENKMACGGRLHETTWGVAHKSLHCGTSLTICYRKCVRVTVIDRGPFVTGRDFDLTYPVKIAIGMPSVGKVRWWTNGNR